MRIEINLEELDPPVGIVWTDGCPARAFTGWLGLLSAMSALIGADEPEVQHGLAASDRSTNRPSQAT